GWRVPATSDQDGRHRPQEDHPMRASKRNCGKRSETARDFDWFPIASIPEIVVACDIPPGNA
ncbi:MAG: hypothetical protein L7W43_12470, partial [Rubripirellula sp.]|nr:hypothetical protein [Rubripirellula sp.]